MPLHPLLFPGLPGGPELLVIILIMVLLAAFLLVPLALVGGAYLYGNRSGESKSADDDADEHVE